MAIFDYTTPTGCKPMTIGEIKRALLQCGHDRHVYFSFGDYLFVPLTVDSWRGLYSEPAVDYGEVDESKGKKPVTVRALLAELELATTNGYDGYKYGRYRYTDSDILHVSRYGYTEYNVVVAVTLLRDFGEPVLLHTATLVRHEDTMIRIGREHKQA